MAGSISATSNGSQAVGNPAPSRAPAKNDAAQSKPAPADLPEGLTPQQQALISELAATDRHVRSHEEAHLAAAGPYATSGASYSIITGPDGKQYAVGGEVSLDTSAVSGDPKATIQKARVIEAAANAPSDPSSQDRAVAAAAAAMEQAADLELSKSQQAAVPSLVKSAYGQKSDAEAILHLLSMTA
jgi:hypothetical protein